MPNQSLQQRVRKSRARWKKIKAGICFARVKSQLDNAYEQQIKEAEKMISEVDKDDDGIPDDFKLVQSGFDAGMYTKDALRARKLLGVNPEIRKTIDELWDSLMVAGGGPDGLMRKKLFKEVNLVLAKALLPSAEWDLNTAEEGAEEDWQHDNKGGVLDREAFFLSIFELVDIWCVTIEASEYVAVANQIADTLLGAPPRGTQIRTLDQVQSMADKPKPAPVPAHSPALASGTAPLEQVLEEAETKAAPSVMLQYVEAPSGQQQIVKESKPKQSAQHTSVNTNQPARYLERTTQGANTDQRVNHAPANTNQKARYLQGGSNQAGHLDVGGHRGSGTPIGQWDSSDYPESTAQQPNGASTYPAGRLPGLTHDGSGATGAVGSVWDADGGMRGIPGGTRVLGGAGGGMMGAGGGMMGANHRGTAGKVGKRKGRQTRLQALAAAHQEQQYGVNTKYMLQTDRDESLKSEVYDTQLLKLAKMLHAGDDVEGLSRILAANKGFPITHKGHARLRGYDVLMLAAKSGRLQCAQELLRRWGAPVLVEICCHQKWIGRCGR